MEMETTFAPIAEKTYREKETAGNQAVCYESSALFSRNAAKLKEKIVLASEVIGKLKRKSDKLKLCQAELKKAVAESHGLRLQLDYQIKQTALATSSNDRVTPASTVKTERVQELEDRLNATKLLYSQLQTKASAAPSMSMIEKLTKERDRYSREATKLRSELEESRRQCETLKGLNRKLKKDNEVQTKSHAYEREVQTKSHAYERRLLKAPNSCDVNRVASSEERNQPVPKDNSGFTREKKMIDKDSISSNDDGGPVSIATSTVDDTCGSSDDDDLISVDSIAAPHTVVSQSDQPIQASSDTGSAKPCPVPALQTKRTESHGSNAELNPTSEIQKQHKSQHCDSNVTKTLVKSIRNDCVLTHNTTSAESTETTATLKESSTVRKSTTASKAVVNSNEEQGLTPPQDRITTTTNPIVQDSLEQIVRCKCGSLEHARISHKSCPLNMDVAGRNRAAVSLPKKLQVPGQETSSSELTSTVATSAVHITATHSRSIEISKRKKSASAVVEGILDLALRKPRRKATIETEVEQRNENSSVNPNSSPTKRQKLNSSLNFTPQEPLVSGNDGLLSTPLSPVTPRSMRRLSDLDIGGGTLLSLLRGDSIASKQSQSVLVETRLASTEMDRSPAEPADVYLHRTAGMLQRSSKGEAVAICETILAAWANPRQKLSLKGLLKGIRKVYCPIEGRLDTHKWTSLYGSWSAFEQRLAWVLQRLPEAAPHLSSAEANETAVGDLRLIGLRDALLTHLVAEVTLRSTQSSRPDGLVAAAGLCRLFCALCRSWGLASRARLFIRDLIVPMANLNYPELFFATVSLWPTLFPLTSTKLPMADVMTEAISFAELRRRNLLSRNTVPKGWPRPEPPGLETQMNEALAFIAERMESSHETDPTTVAADLAPATDALRLLCTYYGLGWAYDNIVKKHFWPWLKKGFQGTVPVQQARPAIAAIMSVIGTITAAGLRECSNDGYSIRQHQHCDICLVNGDRCILHLLRGPLLQFMDTESALARGESMMLVQIAVANALMEMAASGFDECRDAVKKWITHVSEFQYAGLADGLRVDVKALR